MEVQIASGSETPRRSLSDSDSDSDSDDWSFCCVAQEAFPSAVTRQTSWGKTQSGMANCFDGRGIFGVSHCISSSVHQAHQTSMSLSLLDTNGTALLAAAMFSAACVFPWLNDPSLLVRAAFLAYWRCRYSFIIINIPMITDYTKLWWVM
jgi:hypothetical protein